MVGTVEGREIALVRDKVLPVVRLFRRFGVTPRTEDPLDSLLILTESHGSRLLPDGGRAASASRKW